MADVMDRCRYGLRRNLVCDLDKPVRWWRVRPIDGSAGAAVLQCLRFRNVFLRFFLSPPTAAALVSRNNNCTLLLGKFSAVLLRTVQQYRLTIHNEVGAADHALTMYFTADVAAGGGAQVSWIQTR